MDLVDRYLDAVMRYLPKAQQTDIITELRDDIESQMEARESEVGRALSVDEQSEILKTYGPPMIAASRFNKHQYLIGPQLYPYYVNTLKVVLPIVLALEIAFAVIGSLATTGSRVEPFASAWEYMVISLIWVAGVITLIFAIRERVSAPWPSGGWDPRKLPAVREGQPVPRTQTIFELVFYAGFICWLIDVPGVRQAVWFMLTGPAWARSMPLDATQVWQRLISAMIVISVVMVLVDCVNLVRPEWVRLRAAALVVTNVFLIAVLCVVLQSHNFVVIAPAFKHAAGYRQAAAALNQIAYYGLISGAIVAAAVALFNLRTLLRRPARSQLTVASPVP